MVFFQAAAVVVVVVVVVGWVKDFDFLRSKKRNRNPPYKRTNKIIKRIWIYRGEL